MALAGRRRAGARRRHDTIQSKPARSAAAQMIARRPRSVEMRPVRLSGGRFGPAAAARSEGVNVSGTEHRDQTDETVRIT